MEYSYLDNEEDNNLYDKYIVSKYQKLDPYKLLLLTQKGHLDLFEKDIFEHIEKNLS
jgi:hypothetical protein